MSVTRVFVSFSVVTAVGCAGLLNSMAPKPRIVDNPLVSGQPLQATEKGDVSGATEPDCTIWPFEDSLEVRVTEAEICVAIHKHRNASPGWTGEPTASSSESVQVHNDAHEGGSILTTKSRASKVGSCFIRGWNKDVAIWAFDYKGCAPNNGTVTAATKSLTIDGESWEFSGSAGAVAAQPSS